MIEIKNDYKIIEKREIQIYIDDGTATAVGHESIGPEYDSYETEVKN